MTLRRCVNDFVSKLLRLRSTDRAGACTCAAIDASSRINHIRITLGNSGNGAISCTCAAADAIFADFICHSCTSKFRLTTFYYITAENSSFFAIIPLKIYSRPSSTFYALISL